MNAGQSSRLTPRILGLVAAGYVHPIVGLTSLGRAYVARNGRLP
jgi:hypothetical protein